MSREEIIHTHRWPIRWLAIGLLLSAVLPSAGFLLAQTSAGTSLPPLEVHFVNPPTVPLTTDTYLTAEVNRPVEWVRSVTFTVGNTVGTSDWPGQLTLVEGVPWYRVLLPVSSLPVGDYQVAVSALTDGESARATLTIMVGAVAPAPTTPAAVDPAPVTGAIVRPTANAGLSGRVEVEALVSRSVDGLKFYLYSSSLNSGGEITSNGSSDGTVWRAELDTARWLDGAYQLRAIAWDSAGSYPVGMIEVTLANATAIVEPITLQWVSPSAGVVSGPVVVLVHAPSAVERLAVLISGPRSVALEASRSSSSGWSALWDTAGWPTGTYQLTAQSVPAAAVSQPLAVQLAAAGEATMPTASVQFTELGPEGVVSGTLRLVASTQPLVNELGFLIQTLEGAPAAMVPAVFANGRWEAWWESSRLTNATYALVAVARLSGHEFRSDPILLQVANPVTSAEPLPLTPDSDEPPVAPEPSSVAPAAPEPVEDLAPTPTAPPSPSVAPYRQWCATAGIGDEERCRWHLLTSYRGGEPDVVCRLLSDVAVEDCRNQFPASYLPTVCRLGEVTSADACLQLTAEAQLPQRCTAAGISDPTACRDQLEQTYTQECASADVPDATCAAFVRQQINLHEVRCFDQTSCPAATIQQHAAEILFAQRVGEKMEAVVQPLVGRTATLEPARQPARPAATTAVTHLEELVPIRLTGPVEVAVLPATGGVVVEGEEVVTLAPAVITFDADRDGLPDDAERLVGSDPRQADSDGDGFGDAQEVAAGYSPTGRGRLQVPEPVSAVARGVALQHPRERTVVDPQLEVTAIASADDPAAVRTTFSGRGPSGGVVNLYIYSDLPLVVLTDVDAYGNWTYTLQPPLLDGHHEVYVTVNDATGRVVSQSSPLDFFIREARAVTAREYLGARPVPRPTQPVAVYLALAGGVATLGVGLFLLVRRQLRRRPQPL